MNNEIRVLGSGYRMNDMHVLSRGLHVYEHLVFYIVKTFSRLEANFRFESYLRALLVYLCTAPEVNGLGSCLHEKKMSFISRHKSTCFSIYIRGPLQETEFYKV